MSTFKPGLVHTPVTPFTADQKIDFKTFEKVIDFHLKHGAEALAVQMHAGESVSLTDAEQRKTLEFVIKQVNGRVPVIAHVSDSGTGIAVDRARNAERAGAAAVIATSTYYWTPPSPMVFEHISQIGASVGIPFYLLYTPDEMGGTHHINTDMVMKLIDKLPNFSGVVDVSHDWQFMINIVSNAWRKNPAFQLLAGSEYMVSAGAVGASSVFTSLSAVAPRLVKSLHDICRTERYFDARAMQEDLTALYQIVKRAGDGGLKGAMHARGRDCGQPRAPLDPLQAEGYATLVAEMEKLPFMAKEPQGWS